MIILISVLGPAISQVPTESALQTKTQEKENTTAAPPAGAPQLTPAGGAAVVFSFS